MKHPYENHFKKLKQNAHVNSNLNTDLETLLLKQQLQKKTVKKKSKSQFPVAASFFAFLFILAGSFVGLNYESILKNMEKIEIQLSNYAEAEESKPAAANQNINKKDNITEESANKSAEQAKNLNEDQMSIFSGLEKRKMELDAKEAELQKLAEELSAQKKDLEDKIKQLEQIRSSIAEKLEVQVVKDEEKVDALVSFYAGMKPQSAASVMETLDEDLAVKVLAKMKKNEAASILNLVKPEKAKRLSEKFVGLLSK